MNTPNWDDMQPIQGLTPSPKSATNSGPKWEDMKPIPGQYDHLVDTEATQTRQEQAKQELANLTLSNSQEEQMPNTGGYTDSSTLEGIRLNAEAGALKAFSGLRDTVGRALTNPSGLVGSLIGRGQQEPSSLRDAAIDAQKQVDDRQQRLKQAGIKQTTLQAVLEGTANILPQVAPFVAAPTSGIQKGAGLLGSLATGAAEAAAQGYASFAATPEERTSNTLLAGALGAPVKAITNTLGKSFALNAEKGQIDTAVSNAVKNTQDLLPSAEGVERGVVKHIGDVKNHFTDIVNWVTTPLYKKASNTVIKPQALNQVFGEYTPSRQLFDSFLRADPTQRGLAATAKDANVTRPLDLGFMNEARKYFGDEIGSIVAKGPEATALEKANLRDYTAAKNKLTELMTSVSPEYKTALQAQRTVRDFTNLRALQKTGELKTLAEEIVGITDEKQLAGIADKLIPTNSAAKLEAAKPLQDMLNRDNPEFMQKLVARKIQKAVDNAAANKSGTDLGGLILRNANTRNALLGAIPGEANAAVRQNLTDFSKLSTQLHNALGSNSANIAAKSAGVAGRDWLDLLMGGKASALSEIVTNPEYNSLIRQALGTKDIYSKINILNQLATTASAKAAPAVVNNLAPQQPQGNQ